MSSFQARAVSRRKQLIAERAAEFRDNGTWSEQILWASIRRSLLGVQFRRQVPVGGNYIADFYAAELSLIVEVDGLVHRLKVPADARRERQLRRLGFTLLRLEAQLIERQLPLALERLQLAIAQLRGQ